MAEAGALPDAEGQRKEYAQLMRYASDLARIYKEERAKRAALHVAVQTTRRVLDSIGDAVLVVDRSSRILDVNPALCRFIASERDGLLHRNAHEVPELSGMLARLERELAPDAPEQVLEITLPQQPARHVEARVSAYEDEAGRRLGRVWVLRDITAQKRAEETRQEFLAIVSHELRTPLTAVLGFAELLDIAAEGQADQRQTLTDGILANARQLRDIVEQILTFTSIGTDVGTFVPEVADLAHIVKNAVAANRQQAEQMGVAVSVQISSPCLKMHAVEHLLTRAIEQIVNNAIVFNVPRGTVTVDARDEEESVSISVSDTGEGIPPSDLDTIFAPFHREEHFMKAKRRGLGLGLPLAQRIVRWHGGTIEVRSKLGVGSTFVIILPKQIPSR